MTNEDRELMCQQIEEVVKKTVNGKIMSLDAKLDAHMKRVEPYLQAGMGIGILSKLGLTFGGLAAAYVIIRQAISGHF